METLTLEHLAPYLPYGLRCQWNQSKPFELMGLQKGNDSVNNELWTWRDGSKYLTGYLYECKPILRNLSDLTKEIEHNGEKFVPLFELCKMQGFSMGAKSNWEYSYSTEFNCNTAMMKNKDWIFRYLGKQGDFYLNGIAEHNKKHQKSHKQLAMFQKLFEWHFNVFNLPENLFVDINTLPHE